MEITNLNFLTSKYLNHEVLLDPKSISIDPKPSEARAENE